MNQVMNGQQPDDVRARVENACGQPVIGVLPFRAEMATLGSSAIFANRYPCDPLTIAMDQVISSLLEEGAQIGQSQRRGAA